MEPLPSRLLRPAPRVRRWMLAWAWIALLAATLAPTISRWLQPPAFGGSMLQWASLCQAAPGTSPSRTTDDPGTGRTHGGDACGYCTLAQASPGLPAPAADALAPTRTTFPAPHARALPATATRPVRSADARAPPPRA